MDSVRKTALCVFCRHHPVQMAWRPFCSERCQIQDLARWADGSYRVAVTNTDAPTDEFSLENSEFIREPDE